MLGYWAIFTARCRTLLQYRAAALAGLVTQVFWGLLRIMILAAFYRSSAAAQPMTLEECVTYVWLGQASLLIVLFGVDRDVQQMIDSGTVAYELLRPLDLYNLWFARAVALRTAPVLLRAAPMFVLAGLFFGMSAPPSLACAVLWVAATVGAVSLAAAIGTLTTITLLWTVSGKGMTYMLPSVVFVFSGMIVPLPLWPDWLQPLLNFLPFRGLADTPYRLYLGHIPPHDAFYVLAHQAAWTLVFIAAGRGLLARGMHRVVAQGG